MAVTGGRRRRRAVFVAVGVLVVVAAGVCLASPWPSVLVIRAVFEKGADDAVREMTSHVPPTGVTARTDLVYGDSGTRTSLDLFTPANRTRSLPALVWIHGGAWISGSKNDVAPYLRILAADGYAAIGVNYTIAPEATYPTALTQINEALSYLVAHAGRLGIDPDRFVLAGDSAGAQLASQLAAVVTNDAYRQQVGITPALRPEQLRGVVLNCGVYDLRAMKDVGGIVGWGFRTALWAYTGHRDWADTAAGRQMSTIDDVTAAFPPTYISGGNGDGLTATQSVPMAQRLTELGASVTTVFWDGHQPPLNHEYQFHLDDPAARQALERTRQFLSAITATVPVER
jgi:acetyl esterase/lipase